VDLQLKARVEQWFEAHRSELVDELMQLVTIPSITRYGEEGFPYGRACHDAMNHFESLAQRMGFETERDGDHVISAGLPIDPRWKTIGLWAHLDVVPPGNGWLFEPFAPVFREGYVIGRGADDNKSAAVGAAFLMRCLREMDIDVGCNVRVYCGCDEECGSRGVAEYASRHACPDFSIVPDCGFPVCHGEKGIITVAFRSLRRVSGAILSLSGGVAANVIPDTAQAVLLRTPQLERLTAGRKDAEILEDRIILTAHGTSGHAGFPVNCTNAVKVLIDTLLADGLVCGEDASILRFLQDVNRDCYATALGAAMQDDVSGALTCAGTILNLEDGFPCLTANIRYCVTADGTEIHAKLFRAAQAGGYELSAFSDSAPNDFPRENPMVDALTGVYNTFTGECKAPYVMSGGTYARQLPRALGFGIGSMQPPCPLLPQGHGGAHLPDESLHVDTWLRALAILTMGVIEAGGILSSTNQQEV